MRRLFAPYSISNRPGFEGSAVGTVDGLHLEEAVCATLVSAVERPRRAFEMVNALGQRGMIYERLPKNRCMFFIRWNGILHVLSGSRSPPLCNSYRSLLEGRSISTNLNNQWWYSNLMVNTPCNCKMPCVKLRGMAARGRTPSGVNARLGGDMISRGETNSATPTQCTTVIMSYRARSMMDSGSDVLRRAELCHYQIPRVSVSFTNSRDSVQSVRILDAAEYFSRLMAVTKLLSICVRTDEHICDKLIMINHYNACVDKSG
jgi:hypothetical protein